jgi:hypothetical protein
MMMALSIMLTAVIPEQVLFNASQTAVRCRLKINSFAFDLEARHVAGSADEAALHNGNTL